MIARRFAALSAILLLAGAVAANAVVAARAGTDPVSAERWWPGHPALDAQIAETEIGRAAASGQAPGPAIFERLDRVAQRAPLAITPLMARAVAAREAGEERRALRLFELAGARAPRSLAAHYFLADTNLRLGRLEEGLREIVNLARLAPNGTASAAPFFADYARQPANWPRMRAVFAREPSLGREVLLALARDPANVPALLALAQGPDRSLKAPWIAASLDAHVAAGRFAEGRRLWARLAGVRGPAAAVHDPRFRDFTAPPPFNWSLTQSAVGSAERRPGGGLHVTFYGSQSGSLARQLLVLAPGRYRLTAASEGKLAEPQALSWVVACARHNAPLAQAAAATRGHSRAEFSVPPGCPAQWLSLEARAQDIRGDSELRVAFVRIERAGQ